MDRAETPYFVWLAADDYWGPNFLSLAHTALAERADAVSALPACRFTDAPGGPFLPPLVADHSKRLRSYLAAPGGTRMYGLTRTRVLKDAFPRRGMHAYDWLLMMGVLKAGTQITLPQVQLYRGKTPVTTYVDDASEQRHMFRIFPALDMSLSALRAGHIPWTIWGDLLALNLRKHEEFLAYRHPDLFTKMRWFYRLLGLPIARSDEMTREATGVRQTSKATSIEAGKARPKDPPRLVALLTCRNAEPTLARLLDNLAAHRAEVIVIDNGSTDETHAIAEARKDVVREIKADPYKGYFDLTHQLRLKRDIMQSMPSDWFIHADADEFLDSPDGTPLRDYLGNAPDDVHAFHCDELMYLPEDDAVRHSSAQFENTMQMHVRMIERNAKERVFRAGADLARWMATGGHTVTKDGRGLSDTTLILRHYFALSLDQVRSEYLSRVYAAHDLAKFWHGARRTDTVEIVAPPKGLLVTDGVPQTLRSVPVFVPKPAPANAPAPAGTELAVIAEPAILEEAANLFETAMPKVRVHYGLAPAPVPLVHLVRHPGHHHQEDVGAAEAWLRRVAMARQHAVVTDVAVSEFRFEDLASAPLRDELAALMLGQGSGFLQRHKLSPCTIPYGGRSKAIASGMAAEFNYT